MVISEASLLKRSSRVWMIPSEFSVRELGNVGKLSSSYKEGWEFDSEISSSEWETVVMDVEVLNFAQIKSITSAI